MIIALNNPIQPYAWGSKSFLPHFLGVPATGIPQAELWMGAHPVAPSRDATTGLTLHELIAKNPRKWLGAEASAQYGTLPFLMKVLAADEPLSIQAHPSLEQAEVGFAREEALGISRSAPDRLYRDRNHKPELICALTPFEALCGFRTPPQVQALVRTLDARALRSWLPHLETTNDTRAIFRFVATLPEQERKRTIDELLSSLHRLDAADARVRFWIERAASLYPGDMGVLSILLLNYVKLEPGEALYLPAQQLHAYLVGAGIEIMANSDNVLRGGLTPKHVDVAELLDVLNFAPYNPPILRPARAGVYATPAEEFELSRVTVRPNQPITFSTHGPEIVLCTGGSIELRAKATLVSLVQGQSAFVAAALPQYEVHGEGNFFRATLPR